MLTGANGICIIRAHQVLILLKIPDIKYFMQSSCIPGHCHVRVRTFLMLTDMFLSLKAPSCTYNIPDTLTSNTASLAQIDFPKPTAANAIIRKEGQMRYWAGHHG